ncbi:MAG: hypothetical protein U9R58_13975 [Chloroflexota bacterium]|nr:hypothetical protein [Chloroflexota bacterium]
MKEAVITQAHTSQVSDVLFTQDTKTLLSAGVDNLIKLWSVPDWDEAAVFDGHEKSVNALALSPDQTVLLSVSMDRSVRLPSILEQRYE